MTLSYHSVDVDGVRIFYREAGDPSKPAVLLLHGFPTASHMFRDLIPLLDRDFHLVAPDIPGFGQSDMPSRESFTYTFDQLATTMGRFADVIGLRRFALYVFDYGAPVGLRMATSTPERITAIISQNGNAYHEGLSDGFAPLRAYWADPTEERRAALRGLLSWDTTRFQYVHGVTDTARVSPDAYTLDMAYLARSGADEVQLDLFLDYASNLAAYPGFQTYLRDHRPPLLAVWGRNDPFFLPAGAEAYRRDVPDAEVHLLETGHFALETHVAEIAEMIRSFLTRRPLSA
jgi:pimeloyl-ACP methyl ester carboxylesterase